MLRGHSTAIRFICIITLILAACQHDTGELPGDAGFIVPTVVTEGSDAPSADLFSIRLTDPRGDASHLWERVGEFSVTQGFRAGSYLIEAFCGDDDDEGFDRPYYYGASRVDVADGATSSVTITCTRRNVAVSVGADESFAAAVSSCHAIVHSVGGAYFDYLPWQDQGRLYVRHGTCELYLTFTMPDGRTASVLASRVDAPEGADISFSLSWADDGSAIIVDGGGERARIAVSDELFATPGPVVSAEGFDPGHSFVVSEGILPDAAVKMAVSSHVPLSEVILTVQSPALAAMGVESELNLLGDDYDGIDRLLGAGATLSMAADRQLCTLDLTGLLDKLRCGDAAVSPRFSLIAIDCLGQVSSPLALSVSVEPLEVKVTRMVDVIMGATEAVAVITSPSPAFVRNLEVALSADGATWTPVAVTSCRQSGAGTYDVTFALPHEAASSVKVRFSYMGKEIARLPLQFVSPRFSIETDAFAHHAVIRIKAADPRQTAYITRRVRIYTDGSPVNIYHRDEENGLVWITGLTAGTGYEVKATLFESPGEGDFSPSVGMTTEGRESLPNADFEEVRDDISYQDLNMGGRYSQSAMPLYDRQNTTSVEARVPESPWATVNAKTFCTAATNRNTWYMQPSAMESSNIISGAVSVRLVSVAFDPAGEPIADYRQLSQPYISYNPNVPRIACRAAGKLFLGSYSYSPEAGEHYDEGLEFHSRPSALNGVYRYMPGGNSPSDCGRVDVSVIGMWGGKPVTIATNTVLLYPTVTNAVFSVPLTYALFGVRAVSLRIMISSSRTIGDIATETAGVVTSPDLINSSSTGSVLEIDGLSLSY